MKLILVLAVPYTALAVSWARLFQGLQLEGGKVENSVRREDLNGCIANAETFLTHPSIKVKAIEKAMDHCALSKKVDDKNFVCPHYRDILTAAFAREATDKEFTADSFCGVAELYVSQLGSAAKIPHMGKGSGTNFKISKDCAPIVKASLAPQSTLPARSAPDFWYALCMNQDCAHFLPSRTRWCTQNHKPTHSASVCEAIRRFSHDEVSIFGPKELEPDDICGMYDEFVESSYIDVEAYMHVVHGKKHSRVPVPGDKKRALESAKMKHDAKKHGLRDAAGKPVEPATNVTNDAPPPPQPEPEPKAAPAPEEPQIDATPVVPRSEAQQQQSYTGRVLGQLIFGLLYYFIIVKKYPSYRDLGVPTEEARDLQKMNEVHATIKTSPVNCILSYCCSGPRAAHTFYSTLGFSYWGGCILMTCLPCCTLWYFNSFTSLNEKLGGTRKNMFVGLLCACFCSCCVIAQDAETLDKVNGVKTGFCGVTKVVR